MDSSAAQQSPKKRTHDGQVIDTAPSTPATSNDTSVTSGNDRSARQGSPALSTTSSSLTSLAPSTNAGPSALNPSESKPKKRKLNFAERQVAAALKQEEKEAKEKLKEEEKARKDEEKRRREEEKEVARRARELEKAEKQKRKDVEKQAKEAEKSKKDEEKQKKEKSQMRIGAFFGRPALASTPPSTPDDVSSAVSSRRSSIADLDMERPLIDTKPSPARNTDYEKMFPSFFVFENTEVAPVNRFLCSRHTTYSSPRPLVEFPQLSDDSDITSLKETLQYPPTKRRRMLGPVRDIVDRIHGTSKTPVNLTEEQTPTHPFAELEQIPVKFLYFHQDVRPPYQGTYTRQPSPRSAAKIPRNPFYRGLPDTDYDYESEAEWEEPDNDDDSVNLEEDEEESEADEEEMEDFLDDADDVGRRRMVVGDMEPVSTGLYWEGESSGSSQLHDYRMDVLDDETRLPIDPYSTTYGPKAIKATTLKAEIKVEKAVLMHPPRVPLASLGVPNTSLTPGFVAAPRIAVQADGPENAFSTKQKGRATESSKPLKLISNDLLPLFKEAISGSDLTKAGLVEVLKKKFPKVSKDTIKDSISAVATREGVKEADKRWVLSA